MTKREEDQGRRFMNQVMENRRISIIHNMQNAKLKRNVRDEDGLKETLISQSILGWK